MNNPSISQQSAVTEMVDFLSRTSHALALGAFNEVMTPFQVECLDITILSLVMALGGRPDVALPVAETLWQKLQSGDYAAVYTFCLNNNLWWGV